MVVTQDQLDSFSHDFDKPFTYQVGKAVIKLPNLTLLDYFYSQLLFYVYSFSN